MLLQDTTFQANDPTTSDSSSYDVQYQQGILRRTATGARRMLLGLVMKSPVVAWQRIRKDGYEELA